MIHPRDREADNPRLQCVVCGEWKRLFMKAPDPRNGHAQTFFGGCQYSNGNDHLAHKGDDYDVCEICCHVECKRLAANPTTPSPQKDG